MKFYQWMNSRRNKKGFTLIELIIVIAILAVLAAILIPNMITYLDEAKQSTGDTNARTAYSAAAAAEAFIIAEGGTVTAITTATSAEDLATSTDPFSQKLGELLGAKFTGKITVEVENDSVSKVTWADDAGNVTGEYPKA